MSENFNPEFQIPNSNLTEIDKIASVSDIENSQKTSEIINSDEHVKNIIDLRRLAENYTGFADNQKIERKTYPEVALTVFIGKAIEFARKDELDKAA